jgi:DNA-directed RNA polymerase specialized sigma24 family protein
MISKHRIMRDLVRHYLEIESLFKESGEHTFEWSSREHPEPILFSFLDFQSMLKSLSPRKKEAIFHHVILDLKQKDVARIMGITTVSVGQYVDQGMQQLAKLYWPEDEVPEK